MKIKRIIGGNIESNGYVIYDNEGGTGYVIDPGYNPERYISVIRKLELTIAGILLTHHHYDHVGAVDKIKACTGCKVYLHREDCDIYKKNIDVMPEHGDRIQMDEDELVVLHTPGHTRGSVCFFSEKSKLVFTGDTIFNVDLGRTDLADGSTAQMQRSMKDIADKWGNDITIYPGHGDPATMKYVRKHNKEFCDLVRFMGLTPGQ